MVVYLLVSDAIPAQPLTVQSSSLFISILFVASILGVEMVVRMCDITVKVYQHQCVYQHIPYKPLCQYFQFQGWPALSHQTIPFSEALDFQNGKVQLVKSTQ